MRSPDRGDIVWLDFTPQAGREQAGRRPALVLSPRAYHRQTDYVIVCPITTKAKGWGFEVLLPPGQITGVVLADQIRNLDRRVRRIEAAGKAPADVVDDVLAKIGALLGL